MADNFYGQFVEGEFAAVAELEGGAEGGVVFLERLKDGRKLVLEQTFDFFVAEFPLVEYLRNPIAASWVHAHVGGVSRLVVALVGGTAAET